MWEKQLHDKDTLIERNNQLNIPPGTPVLMLHRLGRQICPAFGWTECIDSDDYATDLLAAAADCGCGQRLQCRNRPGWKPVRFDRLCQIQALLAPLFDSSSFTSPIQFIDPEGIHVSTVEVVDVEASNG